MEIWQPYGLVTYFLHTGLGTLGVLSAFVALAAVKGSSVHVGFGRAFVGAAVVAAVTAIVFTFTVYSPAVIASSLLTFSCLGSAIMALRARTRWITVGEIIATIAICLCLFWMLFGAYMTFGTAFFWRPFLYAFFAIALLIGDFRFFRMNAEARRSFRVRRHLSRMGFALAIAIHAPIVSFGDRLGIPPTLAFFGPLLLWPLLVAYFNRRPTFAAAR